MDYFSKSIDWLKKHWMDVNSNWRNTDDPMALGLAWSKAFVAFVALLAVLPNATEDGWEFRLWTFMTSPPNEIGDALAGIAGALAFLWIIVTVQLQSRELAAQRKELRLARKEYAKMAEAQGKQVELMSKQSDIYSAELDRQHQNEAQRMLDQVFETLTDTIPECKELSWWTNYRDNPDRMIVMIDHPVGLFDYELDRGEKTVDELLVIHDRHLSGAVQEIRSLRDSDQLSTNFPKKERCRQLLQITQLALDLSDILSGSQRTRLIRVRISDIKEKLESLLVEPIWQEADQ